MSLDLAKTITFAVVHFSVVFGVAYALTGSVPVATGLALIEPLVNTVAFFFHERAWRWADARQPAVARVHGRRHAHGHPH
jgi:uncharacterized membrane protein